MGPEFLIDTNVVIEFIGNRLPEEGARWLLTQLKNDNHCISAIVQIELLGFNGYEQQMQLTERFIAGTAILPLSEQVVTDVIAIRKLKRIKLGDAIIAATARVHNLTLVTRNTKDFKNIPNLEVINLHDR